MKLGKNFQGVEKSSAGYKLLAAMGWKEGEGLGAKKQGITEHVKVKKKFDNSGVGAAEAAHRARDWSLGMVNYESVLSGLKEVTSHHNNKDDDSSSSEDEEEPLEELQPQKKKQKIKEEVEEKKKVASKRKKAGKPSAPSPAAVSSAPEPSSESESDGEEAAQAAAQERKVASHIGRYRRRESAKMVKNYSTADLAAILGSNSVASSDTVAEVPAPVAAPPPRTSAPPSPAAAITEAHRDPDTCTADATSPETAAVEMELPSSSPKWWSSMFVQASGIGGSRNEPVTSKPAIKISGFSEQDQENLYNNAQTGRSQGRGGLGISDRPKKVAGARWVGKKTLIKDDDDDDDAQADTTTAPVPVPAVSKPAKSTAASLSQAVGIVVLPPLKPRSTPVQTLDAAVTLQNGDNDESAKELQTTEVSGRDGTGPKEKSKGKKSKANKLGKNEQGVGEEAQLGGPKVEADADADTKKDKKAKGQKRRKGCEEGVDAVADVEQRKKKKKTADKLQGSGSDDNCTPVPRPGSTLRNRSMDSDSDAKGACKKKQEEDVDGSKREQGVAAAQSGEGVGKVKWKSVVKQILKDCPKKKMKITKLQVVAMEAAQVPSGHAEVAKQTMLAKLKKLSDLFEVTDKHVVLRG